TSSSGSVRSKTLPGVDLPVPDAVDQVGEEAADGGGAAVQVDGGEEQLVAGEVHVVTDADEADVAAGPGGADGLHHRLLSADGFDHGVGAKAVGEVLDPGDAVVAALGDDVGGTELPGELLARGVAAHRDDPLGAELLCCHHAKQPNRAVADDGDGL